MEKLLIHIWLIQVLITISCLCSPLAACKMFEEEGNSFYSAKNIVELPDEAVLKIFTFLSIEDLGRACQVSKRWHSLSFEPTIWNNMPVKIHGDYSSSEATRENAIKHWLRVIVNASFDLRQIGELIQKYNLTRTMFKD